MYVGVGANGMRTLYEDADAIKAAYDACLVFIDEGETAGRKRGEGGGGSEEYNQTTNQWLKELDGILPRPGVVTMCATNRREMMDPALLRGGRLDRQIEFVNPNLMERHAMFCLENSPASARSRS